MVDVVDADDQVVGRVSRAEMRRLGLRHRAVFVVVRDRLGRVLVHRRSDEKDLWPGRWDLCCGGVVTSGEPYEVAARRELAEELGVECPTDAPPHEIGRGSYDDADVSLVARVYEVDADGPFVFTDDEVVEARFVTLEELADLLGAVSFVPDSIELVVPLVLARP
jgi:isopentenyldiphosphate isomerase